MTYKEIYDRFVEKYPNLKVVDYRPVVGDALPKNSVGIVVWLENGDSFIYLLEEES